MGLWIHNTNPHTEKWRKGTQIKIKSGYGAYKEERVNIFLVGGHLLEVLGKYKYLSKFIEKSNGYYPELYENLEKDRKFWGCSGKIIGREGSDLRKYGILYISLLQAVLLYGS